MKRVPCTQVSERRLPIVSINLSLMCPLCQAMATLTTIIITKNNSIASISCLMLIVLFNRMHYQNRWAKSPSNPQGGGAKNFWYAQESLGVRSTRGSVRLPIGVFDCVLSVYCHHCASVCAVTVFTVCKRFWTVFIIWTECLLFWQYHLLSILVVGYNVARCGVWLWLAVNPTYDSLWTEWLAVTSWVFGSKGWVGLVGVCDAESIWTMPVVTVLDSFLKMIILVWNYRLRFKISGSGPAGTLDPPFTARFERLVRFWTDTLCPPGVTLGHVTASMARWWGMCILLCSCVVLCTMCCVAVLMCTAVLMCSVLLCSAVLMCVFTGSCPYFW